MTSRKQSRPQSPARNLALAELCQVVGGEPMTFYGGDNPPPADTTIKISNPLSVDVGSVTVSLSPSPSKVMVSVSGTF